MLINDELDTIESKEFINGLSISALALDNVLQDLNTILQVKRDINDKKEPIYFSNLVNDISYSIANLVEKNQVKIIQDFSSAKKIFSIRDYLYGIFYNLIINSIKYRQLSVNPVIEISSEIKMGKIVLTFKDNGLGIDLKSNSNRVFGLYNRFHWHVEGKGMGLFMTKSQVFDLGGTKSIKSEPLKGTLITIEI
ncbi:MAG: HAMP domain-containing histidine kinase [Bacteroidia bacterium]|nr:HAMP domain-containing histidine kinase [Bacteroidia bacterium]